MTANGRYRSIAGTARAYDPCPVCGHARIKHLSVLAGGCTEPLRAPVAATGNAATVSIVGCDCPLDKDFLTEVI